MSRKRKVDPKQQPDQTYREATSDDRRYEGEHRFSTESPRWNDGDSRPERGYPAEGERSPTSRSPGEED